MANGIKRNDDGTFTVSKAWLADAPVPTLRRYNRVWWYEAM